MDITIIITAIIIITLIVTIFTMGYVKAPPDMIYIISGFRRKPKIFFGRASIRIPFLERLDRLPLGLISIDIRTEQAVPTKEFINISVDGVANIKIGDDAESIAKASQNFLGKTTQEIQALAQQVLEGNMREIIGQLALQDLVHNRDQFAQNVQRSAAEDMARMGLVIINLTIQNFTDENGVINDLGIDNIEQIKKDAAIAKANSHKEVQIAEARARQESNEAQALAQAQISRQNTELLKQQAAMKIEADTKQAEADAAYKIQEEEQRKRLEIASASADLAQKTEQIKVREQEIALREKELDATVRKEAEADKYRAQMKSDAQFYEAQREADAEAYRKVKEAEAIKTLGEAEAQAISLKAEAQSKMQQASVLEMVLEKLPEMVKNAAAPLEKTEKIVMFGEGNSSKLVKDVMGNVTQVIDGVKESTGLDISTLLGGVLAGKTALSTSIPENASNNETNQSDLHV